MPPVIACLHTTPRAVGPVAESLLEGAPELERRDYLEERLLELKGKGDEAFSAFIAALHRAEAGEPAAILITCSIYSQHLPRARELVRTPLLGIDEPMIERAVEIGGRLVLAGSITTSIELTAGLISRRAAELGSAVDVSRHILVGLDACDTSEGVRRLADQLRAALPECDGVVVVQASLSPVARVLSPEENESILTSPRLAVARLREMVLSPPGGGV